MAEAKERRRRAISPATQLMLKAMFEIIATMVDDRDEYAKSRVRG
jgi:hypothetical protein